MRTGLARGALVLALCLAGEACKEKELAPEQYFGRGVALQKDHRVDEALADFDKAIQLKPEYAEAYTSRAAIFLGRALYTQDPADYDRAIADYSRAIAMTPTRPYHPSAHYFRGEAYRNRGKEELAKADFKAACELGNEAGCRAARALGVKVKNPQGGAQPVPGTVDGDERPQPGAAPAPPR